MAKTDTPRRKTRQRKAVTVGAEGPITEEQTETVCSSEQTENTETKQGEKSQDEQDSQMDCVIEVKGSKPTVAVSWEKTNEEEGNDSEKRSNPSDQLTDQEMMGNENTPNEDSETKMEQEMQKIEDKQESQMDTEENGSTTTVTETGTVKPEEGQSSSIQQETNGYEQMVVEEKPVKTRKRKRKAQANAANSPSKKTKLINDGFCIYAGNLNNSKTFEEVKDSLASYLMTQSLLFQDIRLDRSKKHAHVDLASEMDLTKALTLNGEMILDKPVKIAKAKVKSADKVKTPEDKKAARNARCLFVKNLPLTAKKTDIQKIFPRAINIRFPGGAERPTQGIAFVEFKNPAIAKRIQKKKQGAKIKGRVLIVDFVGETNVTKVSKASDTISNTKAAAPPNNTLFVSNVSHNLREKNFKKLFQNAVSIKLPQSQGKSKGYAFVEFATVAEAEKALKSTHNVKIGKRTMKVQFFEMRANAENAKVDSKTLIIKSLSENTTAETLQSAFEGALTARVAVDKETGASKRFGFVEFESEEKCKAFKEAMQDCEIDGSKVTVAYAKLKGEKGEQGIKGDGQPAVRGASRGVDSKTLIIKKLSEKTTAETLQSAVKGALTARVAVDKETGASKRFGFVEFESEKKCKAVKEAMQDCEIDGSKVTVAYAKQKGQKGEQGAKGGGQPAARGRGSDRSGNRGVDSKTLIIKKLSEKTTAETLKSAVKGALTARVAVDKETGASKRFGFVEFESEEKCKAVKEAMQDCEIDGSKVTVAYAKQQEKKGTKEGGQPAGRGASRDGSSSRGVDSKTLIIKKLSGKTTAETLQSAVKGALTARVAVDKETGASKRFGFVEFESEEKCKAFKEAMQDCEIDGNKVTVANAKQQEKKGAKGRGASKGVDSKTLIIKKLSENTTAETLQSAVEGALTARVAVDKETGASKRFGFVEFESEEKCKAFKEAMQDCEIDGSKVTVAYAKQQEKKGAKGRGASRGGRGRGAGAPQDTVEKVKNKG
ncbi:nucleolin-like isoform X2 [Paralichthys olivaceus]|uniref:nucleolin-like isoform X2 n=1 Tax=Paralichthys olivaceus TaxID=8255 RepID=UPI00375027FA